MKKIIIILLISFTASVSHAALVGRLETTAGSGIFQAYYDTQLDITWASNANINGYTTWDSQVAWASTLTIGGVSGWRLPDMDVNNDGRINSCSITDLTQASCKDNEYGHLFMYGAGTTKGSGITNANPGPFSNIVDFYWSSTKYAPSPDKAWYYDMVLGYGLWAPKNFNTFAWAVQSGDISEVPIPAAFWLFGSGLIGLIGIAKRKKSYQE